MSECERVRECVDYVVSLQPQKRSWRFSRFGHGDLRSDLVVLTVARRFHCGLASLLCASFCHVQVREQAFPAIREDSRPFMFIRF